MFQSLKLYIGGEVWIALQKAELGMKTVVLSQLVSRGMQGFVIELVWYGSKDNGLRVREREEGIVYNFKHKHLPQKLLPAI